jgi:hypothetical protein
MRLFAPQYKHWKRLYRLRRLNSRKPEVPSEQQKDESRARPNDFGIDSKEVRTLSQKPEAATIPNSRIDIGDSRVDSAYYGIIEFGGGTMATRRFHSAVIEGMEFYAIMSVEGPYVATEPPGGGVALGRSTSICFLETPGSNSRNRQPHWAVVKYGDQERIDLSRLSPDGRKQLSQEFGIPICEISSYEAKDEFFRSSAAFRGLCEWARSHPRLYTQYSPHQNYLPGWPKMVAEALGSV